MDMLQVLEAINKNLDRVADSMEKIVKTIPPAEKKSKESAEAKTEKNPA